MRVYCIIGDADPDGDDLDLTGKKNQFRIRRLKKKKTGYNLKKTYQNSFKVNIIELSKLYHSPVDCLSKEKFDFRVIFDLSS